MKPIYQRFESNLFCAWLPAARFTPTTNDMMFITIQPGCYSRKDKVSIIMHWQREAEQIAVKAILKMTGKTK
jgi:hypothetical protein